MGAIAYQEQTNLELAVYSRSDARPAQLVHQLCTFYPNALTARKLMGISGFALSRDPVTPFVEFINMVNRINRTLIPLGWNLQRTGGTPDDHYRLTPIIP